MPRTALNIATYPCVSKVWIYAGTFLRSARLKSSDVRMRYRKMQHSSPGVENAGRENARNHEYGKPRMHKNSGQWITPAVRVFDHNRTRYPRYARSSKCNWALAQKSELIRFLDHFHVGSSTIAVQVIRTRRSHQGVHCDCHSQGAVHYSVQVQCRWQHTAASVVREPEMGIDCVGRCSWSWSRRNAAATTRTDNTVKSVVSTV